MPDIDKVIKRLEAIVVDDWLWDHAVYYAQACKDAIALLKKQEPKQIGLYGKDEWYGMVCICPDCNAEWMSKQSETHFCPSCGRSVKWE